MSTRDINLDYAAETASLLRKKFSTYTTTNLKGITPTHFANVLHSKIGVVDAALEGYSAKELDRQRDFSIKFHWGHNHDFGEFRLEGRMADRHIELLANFVTFFPPTLDDFAGKHIFDIGCWTGGTTLLLAALAAEVYAIEEVKKYSETVRFLAESFDVVGQVTVDTRSLYRCNSEEFYDRFDIVYFPGVIYHLSDPLLALRILFNSLKTGGIICVESAGINNKQPLCRFEGSLINYSGTEELLNRGGWNWYLPSPSALYRMMLEVGFDEIETRWHRGRVYGYGCKKVQKGICRAGLSVPDIR